jgi:hypothetical protein
VRYKLTIPDHALFSNHLLIIIRAGSIISHILLLTVIVNPISWLPPFPPPRCLDFASTPFHPPIHFFLVSALQSTSRGPYRSEELPTPGLFPATRNWLLVKPSGSPWVNCAWVEVSCGRYVGGRTVKAPSSPRACHAACPSMLQLLSLINIL